MKDGKPAPARLAPIFVPRIWGTRTLAPLFHESVGSEPIGEVWLTGERCRFETGGFSGRSLGEVWPTLPTEWTGSQLRELPRIPLLVKFIFPEDKLSVQVHPNDEYAKAHEGADAVGKTEMWYAISARPGAAVRLGFEAGVTAQSFRQAIHDGTAESCLRAVPVCSGDVFFVPAGTPHTIGPGMVLCEVQQHSDITYRVFDYNRLQSDGRPRALHIRQALDVLHFGNGTASSEKVAPPQIQRGPLSKIFLVACRYFATERWEFSGRIAAATSPKRFELLILISGAGRLEWDQGSADYSPAQLWLLPAALGAYNLTPESPTSLLRTFVPDLDHYAHDLASQGLDQASLNRVVHP